MGSFKRAGIIYNPKEKEKYSYVLYSILYSYSCTEWEFQLKKLHQLQDKIQVRRQPIHLRYKTIWQQISQEQCQRVW